MTPSAPVFDDRDSRRGSCAVTYWQRRSALLGFHRRGRAAKEREQHRCLQESVSARPTSEEREGRVTARRIPNCAAAPTPCRVFCAMVPKCIRSSAIAISQARFEQAALLWNHQQARVRLNSEPATVLQISRLAWVSYALPTAA